MVRVKMMVILGGGGHTRELLELIKELDANLEFVVSKDARTLFPAGTVYRVKDLRAMGDSALRMFANAFPAFYHAFRIVSRTRCEVILTSGPAIAVPYIILGKLFRKKVIFIENMARVYSKSRTGSIAYWLSDLFFVQWKGLKRKYPDSVYAGRLM